MPGWSTGLCAIFDDLDVLTYGMTLPNLLAVHNSVVMNDNQSAFNLPGDKLAETFECAGCTKKDGAMVMNACVCQCVPCIYVLWRMQMREKFNIDGSPSGDLLIACCCPQCGIMQEARELKRRGFIKPRKPLGDNME